MEDTHIGVLDVEAHTRRSWGEPSRSAFFGVRAARPNAKRSKPSPFSECKVSQV